MKAYYMKHFAHAAPKGFLDIPGIMDIILPPLQMDLGMNQMFWWDALSVSEKRPLDVCVHAFVGEKDDGDVNKGMEEWRKHTKESARFHVHRYSGNHFFIHEDQNFKEVLDDIANVLSKCIEWVNVLLSECIIEWMYWVNVLSECIIEWMFWVNVLSK